MVAKIYRTKERDTKIPVPKIPNVCSMSVLFKTLLRKFRAYVRNREQYTKPNCINRNTDRKLSNHVMFL